MPLPPSSHLLSDAPGGRAGGVGPTWSRFQRPGAPPPRAHRCSPGPASPGQAAQEQGPQGPRPGAPGPTIQPLPGQGESRQPQGCPRQSPRATPASRPQAVSIRCGRLTRPQEHGLPVPAGGHAPHPGGVRLRRLPGQRAGGADHGYWGPPGPRVAGDAVHGRRVGMRGASVTSKRGPNHLHEEPVSRASPPRVLWQPRGSQSPARDQPHLRRM